MTFLFSKPDTKSINNVIRQIENPEKLQEIKYTKKILFERDDVYGGYVIDVMKFFENEYCNVRPKQLIIECRNLDSDSVEKVTVWYFHTPLVGKYVKYETLSKFKTKYEFNDKIEIENNNPYMTPYEIEGEEVSQIGMSQLTNVNVVPYKSYNMSIGQLFFELERKKSGTITVEITMKIKCSIKNY